MKKTEKDRFIAGKNKLFTFVWLFLIVELAVFLGVAYFFFIPQDAGGNTEHPNDFHTMILYISYFAVIAVIPLAYKVSEIKKKQAQKTENLNQKTEIYFFNLLINFSLFELAGVLVSVAVYLNKMTEPLYMFGIIFIALILNKPSLKNFIQPKKEYNDSQIITVDEDSEITGSEEIKDRTL